MRLHRTLAAAVAAVTVPSLLLTAPAAADPAGPADPSAAVLVTVDGDPVDAAAAFADAGVTAEVLPELGVVAVHAPADVVADIAADGDVTVVDAEADAPVRAFGDVTATRAVNDPYAPFQWGLHLTDVPEAWDTTTGSADVVVAVIDTGVSEIPELTGRVLPGRDFVNDDFDAVDDNGHGTESAAVIAAAGDNGSSIAGVCWSCTILPVKVLGANGGGSSFDVAQGIVWAVDQGADILNLSLGGPGQLSVLDQAVAYARANGVVVLAAASNEGVTTRSYPAASPGAVSIAATDENDVRYEWSNYGADWVHLAAPGCNIAQAIDEQHYWYCGTSSATPVVSGIAALLLAADPTLSDAGVVAALEASAVPVGDFVAWGRVDADGALTAAANPGEPPAEEPAPSGDTTPPTVTFTSPQPGFYQRGVIEVTGTATDDSGTVTSWELHVDGVRVTSGSGPLQTMLDTAQFPSGAATLKWVAFDEAGNRGVVERTIGVDNTPPTVSFTSPRPGKVGSGTVTVTADASDDEGISYLVLLANDMPVGYTSTAPYSVTVDTRLAADGPVTLKWRVFDYAGNVGVVQRRVVADNTAPTATIISPNPGRPVSGTVTIGAAIGDTVGVAETQLWVNGQRVSSHTGAPATIAWDSSTVPEGQTLLRLRVRDRGGNVTWSPTRTVTVDRTAPTITFAAPSPNASITAPTPVVATPVDNRDVRRVVLYANGVRVGQATSAPWTVEFDPDGFTGTVRLKWVVFDTAGNRGVVERNVRVS